MNAIKADATSDKKDWGKVSATFSEEKFLQGPQTRSFEFFHILTILFEFIKGFRKLHFVGPCITVFGSARVPESSPYYAKARKVGSALGQAGFTVMTGGGPGIMEAANRGAKDVGAKSVGCNITLPKEQKPNPYLDLWMEFNYFFVRKVMLSKYSYAFIAFPGGFGTLDETFEVCTLIQTGKIKDFPIILIGVEFWKPLIGFIENTLVTERMIEAKDRDAIYLTDSIEDAMEYIRKRVFGSEFGLQYIPKPKSWWLFGE